MDLAYGGLDPQQVDAIRGFEGYKPNAYGDYKQYSIGYGSKANHPNEVIDKDEAERRLNNDLNTAAGYVDSRYPDLPPERRAPLVSLTQNSGTKWMNSGLGAAVGAGDWDAAGKHFAAYNQAGGQPLDALSQRRASEWSWGSDNPVYSAFAANRKSSMNPMDAAWQNPDAQPSNQYAYSPAYDPNAGLFDRLRSGGPGALFGAPHGVFPGKDGKSGYDLGTALQKAALFAMNKPEAMGAVQPDRKFVQIGTDTWGNPRYGWVDPRVGTVTPADAAGAAGANGGTGGASGNAGGVDPVQAAIASGKTGEELLAMPGIPEQYKTMVRGINSGSQPYSEAAMLRQPYGRPLSALLQAYEPGADLQGRQAAAKDWATKSNEITRRASQAARHGSELVDSLGAIKGSTSYPLVNSVINTVDEQTGGDAMTKAGLNVTAFANEMGALVRGNGGSDASFNEWAKAFPTNGSEAQKRGAIMMGAKLFRDSMEELNQKRERGLGPVAAARKGPLFSKEVMSAVDRMDAYGNGGDKKTPGGITVPGVTGIRQISP